MDSNNTSPVKASDNQASKYTLSYDTPVLVVGTAGHVWVCRMLRQDSHHVYMYQASIVREWGTTKGLNELIGGPTAKTIVDSDAPVVVLSNIALIAVIPCRMGTWGHKRSVAEDVATNEFGMPIPLA
jgi:hypothetical protein